jgi:hypothetical protein
MKNRPQIQDYFVLLSFEPDTVSNCLLDGYFLYLGNEIRLISIVIQIILDVLAALLRMILRRRILASKGILRILLPILTYDLCHSVKKTGRAYDADTTASPASWHTQLPVLRSLGVGGFAKYGGERGIRTLDTLLRYT